MPPFLTGRPTVVASLILTFFFLIFLSSHHFPSPSSPSIQTRSVAQLPERQVTVTFGVTRVTTVFTTDSVTSSITVPLRSAASSLPASSSSSVPPPASSSHSSVSLPTSSSLNVGSSSLSSSRINRSTKAETLPSTTSTSTSPSTFILKATTSDTLNLVPTTLSLSTPSTTLIPTGNVVSPTTLVVADPTSSADPTASTDQVAPSSPPAAPVQASNSGTGFWSNKGAVGGTFTAVALVVLGALVFLVVTFLKRLRRKRAQKFDEELYGNLFEPEHSRNTSSHDAHSLTYPAVDPFAAGEVVQVRSGAASLPTTGVMSNGPSAFKGSGHTSSDDDHTSSNDHSSSNHHGFSSISYRTGASDSRGNLTQREPPLFYQPPSVTLRSHPYNSSSNLTALPQSTSTMPLTYNNPVGGPDTYYTGQLRSYYHGAGASDPPAGPSGRAF